MQVEIIYQDAEGKWHIDYNSGHLMGLAIRVYWGQFLINIFIGLIIGLPLLILATLVSAKSLDTEKSINPSSNSIVPQTSSCTELYNY